MNLSISDEWTNFRWSSKVLNGICKYLNEQKYKQNPESKSIEAIALYTWYEHLFAHLNEKISNAAIRMLRRNRDGQEINSTAINAVIDSYIDLGFYVKTNELDESNHLTVCFHLFCFWKFNGGLLKMFPNNIMSRY